MSAKERIRLDALGRVKRKELTVPDAAALMGLSVRQARRVWKRFKQLGDAGVVHRLRGLPSNRRLSAEVRERAIKLHQEKYADFGPTFACEKLAEDGLDLSPDTLVTLLKGRGLWRRRRRRGKHRKRRDRHASFGSMLQIDGSHHDWFEGRGPKCVLMVIIDDASNITYARFYPAETTAAAAFDIFERWARLYGLPRSVYADRHSIYRNEDHPQKPTQFGRAMKELGVQLIAAHSPQAKGRVERRHAVFQDRLVKQMRLRGIRDIAQANALLGEMFLADLNRRYAVKPADETDLHRALDPGLKLDEVLCVQEGRTVGQDWCVRWKSRWLQIGAAHASVRLPRRRVWVRELSDGRLLVDHQGTRLSVTELAARPTPPKARKTILNNRRYKPAANHPWKSEPTVGPRPPLKSAPAAPPRTSPAGKRKAG